MPEIPNVVGHVVGPLIWMVFLALMLWSAIWGAVVERRERAAERGRTRRPVRLRRGRISTGEPPR